MHLEFFLRHKSLWIVYSRISVIDIAQRHDLSRSQLFQEDE